MKRYSTYLFMAGRFSLFVSVAPRDRFAAVFTNHMTLSLFSDYSLRLLMYAAIKGGLFRIEEVTEAYGVSKNHLAKVVQALAKLGYLETRRGRGGGILLAKEPAAIRLGALIRAALNDTVTVRHPATGQTEPVELTLFVGPPEHPTAHGKNVVTMGRHIFDRSPGGTGTSARLVQLWAKGELPLGQPYVNESIIGTLFQGRLVEEVTVGQQTAVIPEISGRAFITGLHQFVLAADDPLTEGFLVGGT